ncbi:MAG: M12 family metallo-peptidase [Gemmatimonadetes bacterium]|nr:M12 family metallo-peptidase [Gemmatimonadota bacterium]
MQKRDSIYAASKQALNLNVGPPRTVRMIYFLPNDRPFRASVVDSMKRTIRRIQTFYGEQMQAHGYGYMTFAIESDASGEPIVHLVNGLHADSHYLNNTYRKVIDEVEQVFDRLANIYLFVVDNSSNMIGTSDGFQVAGVGGNNRKSSGGALVPSGFSFRTAAHELGHAFGLSHDFRDNAHIMSYGGSTRDILSDCNARFLEVHPYLNNLIPIEEDEEEVGPTRELLSSQEYPVGTGRATVRIRVSDSDGLHQVLLFATTITPRYDRQVKMCRALDGVHDSVVELAYDGAIPSRPGTSLSNPERHEIHVEAVDIEGNVGHMRFSLMPIPPNRIGTLVHSSTGFSPDVKSVAFSPDGTFLASGSAQGTIKLWNVATQRNIRTLHDAGSVRSVVFSPDGTILASHSDDVTLWNVSTGQKIATLFSTYSSGAVAFSPDGAILASGSPDNKVRLWNVSTRQNVATMVHGEIGPSLYTVAFSPDSTILASGSQDGIIKLWSATKYEEIATLETQSDAVLSVAFSPDGNLLASAEITQDPTDYSWDSSVKLWDVGTKRDVATIEADTTAYGYTYWFQSVAFSPSGKFLATGSADNTVKLWDTDTQRKVASLGHANHESGGCIGAVHSVAFSPTGDILASGVHVGNCGGASGASGPWTGEVHLWDVSQYTSAVPQTAGSNADAVLSLDLIPEGGTGNQMNDGVTSGTVSGKDTKIAVEVFASGVKTSLAGLLVKFDFDSSILAFVKAESGAFGFNIPQATGTYFAATNNVVLPASGFLARGEFKTLVDVTNRPLSIGIDVVNLAESQTLSNDIRTTKVISFNAAAPPATFSISLDGNTAAGDQGVTMLDVAIGSVVPIQLFGNNIRGVNGVSAKFEYDATQVGYEGVDPGSLLPNAQVLAVPDENPTAIDISVVSFGGQAAVDSGLVGSVRFLTTDDFSGTTLRLVSAEIGRGEQRESIAPTDIAVTLRLSQPSPDFNGDGTVDFGDFVAFGMHFGASRGDARYEAKYDLDQDGTIGFGDFLIFGQAFGT